MYHAAAKRDAWSVLLPEQGDKPWELPYKFAFDKFPTQDVLSSFASTYKAGPIEFDSAASSALNALFPSDNPAEDTVVHQAVLSVFCYWIG